MRDSDKNDVTNMVVRTKVREGYDFKLLPKECWNVLHEKYGGTEIKRVKDNDTYSRRYNIKFPIVTIPIFP